MFFRLLILLIAFSVSDVSGSGNPCDILDVTKDKKEIKRLLNTENGFSGLKLADSIIVLIYENDLIDCEESMWIFIRKGECLELILEYEEALVVYHEIIQRAKSNRHWEILAETYISIGRIHETIGRELDCKRSLGKAKVIIDKHKLYKSLAHYAVRYASYHRIYDNRDTARNWATLAVKYGREYNVGRSEIDGNLILGIVATDIDTAIFHFNRATDLFVERNSFYGAATQTFNIATLLHRANRDREASIYTAKAEKYLSQKKEKTKQYYNCYSWISDMKSQIFQAENQIDSAFHYLLLSNDQTTKASYITNQNNISQLEIQESVDKQKNKLLKLRNQKKLYFNLLIFGFLVFCILAALLRNIYNNRKKITIQHNIISSKNVQLNKVLEKQATLLSEIHHRVKNNLQMVISLLVLQGEKSNNSYTRDQLLAISNKIGSIALIHDQLYNEGKFDSINLFDYFDQLFTHHCHLASEKGKVEYKININDLHLNIETVVPLGIICSELIINSIKYANPINNNLDLTLNIEKLGDWYNIKYHDNGKGYLNEELETSSTGMGSMLIFSMARQLIAKVKTYNEEGAVFELVFVEKHVSDI